MLAVTQAGSGTKVPIQVVPKATSQVVTVRPSPQATVTTLNSTPTTPLIRINTGIITQLWDSLLVVQRLSADIDWLVISVTRSDDWISVDHDQWSHFLKRKLCKILLYNTFISASINFTTIYNNLRHKSMHFHHLFALPWFIDILQKVQIEEY